MAKPGEEQRLISLVLEGVALPERGKEGIRKKKRQDHPTNQIK
jgi:hypothetical protein